MCTILLITPHNLYCQWHVSNPGYLVTVVIYDTSQPTMVSCYSQPTVNWRYSLSTGELVIIYDTSNNLLHSSVPMLLAKYQS